MEGIKTAKRGTPIKVVHGYYTGNKGVLVSKRKRNKLAQDFVVRMRLTDGRTITVQNGYVQPYKPRASPKKS